MDTLIINGAECEPYITSDYRECIENTDGIVEGILHVLKWTGIEKAMIGIEDNKPEAIKALSQAVSDIPSITVHSLPPGIRRELKRH